MSSPRQQPIGSLTPRSWANEARAKTRYSMEVDLEYRLVDAVKGVITGRGRSINLSSTGVLFESETALMPGMRVALFVVWPARLESGIGLKLCITGRTIRAQ